MAAETSAPNAVPPPAPPSAPPVQSSGRPTHRWRFFRVGGFDQVRLETGPDFENLDQLDQKLWVALCCPTRGIEFDTRTLDLIDADRDGRIRAPEVIAAVKWACANLKNPGDLARASSALPLAAINDATPEGKQLLASARQILKNLGKPDATAITVDDTVDTVRIFAQTQFNGDGIVPVEAAEDPAVQSVIADVIKCLGAETDRSGRPGVNEAKVQLFWAEATAYSEWWRLSESGGESILALGPGTEAAVGLFKSVRAKVDDYFARCRLAAFDSRAIAALNREEKEYLALAAKDLTVTLPEIAALPLARIEAGKPLPLAEAINPAWSALLGRLRTEVVKPVVGDRATLSESDWATICSKLAPYEAWVGAKAGTQVEVLGLKRIREILSGNARDAVLALIAKDRALEPEANAIAAVERLTRYHRDLVGFLNNFVSFRDFYDPARWGTFQVGTLFLDQRSCELCVRVDDPGKHAALAGLAKTYLAYCDCTRPSGEKMTIAAGFTGGDSDNLMIGRNGLFYDRKGRDWDATITKVVENPISIRQAFWAPYKKFVRVLEEQVAKRASAAEAAGATKLEAAATSVAVADKTKPAPAPKGFDVGTVAALGVGVGAIGTLLGGFVSGFLKLSWWQMPLAVIGILLLISLPSVVIAALKLRQRNLGPILDANGWAINSRARLNIPFGGSLTRVATLPADSERSLEDPFAEKPRPWGKILAVALGIILALTFLNHRGKLYDWFGIGKQVDRSGTAPVIEVVVPPSAQ